MLKIYQSFFEELNVNHIPYIVYKGLAHLEEDLNGLNGDIDVLIDKKDFINFNKIAIKIGLSKVINKRSPTYYYGIDIDTHRFVMIDVVTTINLGNKPYKPYYINIKIEKIKKTVKDNIYIIDNMDYIPLLFMLKLSLNQPKLEDLKLIKSLILKVSNIQKGYIVELLEKKLSKCWDDIKNDILTANSWQVLQNSYSQNILRNANKNYYLLLKQFFHKKIFLFKIIKKKFFRTLFFKIRKKGKLIVFIGVDGSGKSSTVNYVSKLQYFKKTGIKVIYFGNNKYSKPITWAFNKFKRKPIRTYIQYLSEVDKILRSVKAYYYIKKGYIVLADRFYYDSLIGLNKIEPNKNLIKRCLFYLIKPRVWIKPNATIFLDVSPEVAYKRKQDFSYEKMLQVNKAYKKYMSKVLNVYIINADQKEFIVYNKVLKIITNLDKVENNN